MTIVAADKQTVVAPEQTAQKGWAPIELFAAGLAFLLPIAVARGLAADTWSLRAAILLVVAGVGLPILLSQTRGPRPLAARAAVAFLVFGTASAVLSHNHTTAIFGLYNQGTGLLFMASLASAWAIGRCVRPEARPLIERALLAGVFINVGVALLASVVDFGTIGVTVLDPSGRSSGLAANPVHLAALAVLGLALIVPRFVARPAVWSLPVAAIAAAAQLSGTRGALVVMAGVVIWAGRRHGLRVAAMLAVLLVLGVAGATAVGSSSAVSATARAGHLDDWRNRPVTWLSTRHVVVAHPLLGIGPGQVRTATSPYRTIAVGRSERPDRLASDAHNIFVEYLTTTGLLGLGALVVWLVAATRSARGWLLVAALGVFAIHLFEPQSVVTTPLAFLALGASGSFGGTRVKPRRSVIQWLFPVGCVAVAMAAASVFLFGQFQANQAQLDLIAAPAQQADRLLPAWPATASALAQVWLFHGITNGHDQADYERSRSWRVVAVQRDSTDPGLWNDLGELDVSIGRSQDASAEFTTALRLNPTSARAMLGLAQLARGRCDPVQEQYWLQRASQVTASTTPGPARANPTAPKCAG